MSATGSYECLLLVNPLTGAQNWEAVEAELNKTITRYDGTVSSVHKWGERKLAYPIRYQQQKFTRGLYVLVYFECPTDSIAKMRLDFRLSENIIRFIIMRLEEGQKRTDVPKDFETAQISTEFRGYGRRPQEEPFQVRRTEE